MSHPAALSSDEKTIHLSLRIALRLAMLVLLVAACFTIIRPFTTILAWAIILAVALKPVFEKLVGMMGGRRGRAATVFSILAIVLITGPSYMIGQSLVGSIQSTRTAMEAGTLEVPPPPENLQNLPFVGQQAYDAWLLSSDDIQQAVTQLEPQIRTFGRWLLGFLGGIAGAVLQTLVALIVASVLLTYAESATRTLRAVGKRIEGGWDEDFLGLAAATISSVATGVLGVGLIQAGVSAVGLFIAGVPAAGLITIGVLILSIVQVPVLLVMIFPIIWGFSNLGTFAAIVFAVFCVAASAADMPLKAVLLGRGLSVPTAVILLGAIGGMVVMGMMGLFLGAVVLGIGYSIFRSWLGAGRQPDEAAPEVAGA